MLRGITYTQLREWQAYDAVEPFGPQRADVRAAQIERALWSLFARSSKMPPTGWPLSDFVVRFGDTPAPTPAAPPKPARTQTVAEIEQRIGSWVNGSNVRHRERQRR